ncbi:hypothetical protein L1987_61056 [Smallanthus sonchifolius]|uniref:Uncharacterized protein n=1 Tax=Smallanthus sonchifolius TaxID=185202 RepID=A0ACB9D9Q8_9ASTR|nr:hypothetical protein L1987_61056 [Smallanthus sonchifolius]
MLPAKMVLYDSSTVKCFKWKSLAESSLEDASIGRGNIFHHTYERIVIDVAIGLDFFHGGGQTQAPVVAP